MLREEIKHYLLEKGLDRSKPGCYLEIAKKFNTDSEIVRSIYRRLRKKGLVETNIYQPKKLELSLYKESGDIASISTTSQKQVSSLDDLIKTCNIDTKIWDIISWECKSYDGLYNSVNNKKSSKTNFSISAKLKRKKLDSDLQLQKNLLLSEIKNHFSKEKSSYKEEKCFKTDGILLELSCPDLHLGKLSWNEETGEDYDIKIACERFREAINDLLSKTPLDIVDRILFPIGNDMIQIDSRKGTTTAGTIVDSDSRFRKMLIIAKNLLIETIDKLSMIAPVDVIVVSGNHDYDTMFSLGMILEAFYHNNSSINIDNSAKQRKYYQYFNTGILFTHGNEEKHNDLGLIFATENPKLWSSVKFREVQLGHFHKNKKLNYVSVDDFTGFQIVVLPSLSAADFWHNSKGYMSLKQAKAFLYDKTKGKIAEFTYNI